MWVHVDIIATLNSAICVILLLGFSCYHHSPHPLPLNLYICWPNIDILLKSSKTGKISHYNFARLVVQNLIDSKPSIVLLSKWGQQQSEAGFHRLNFQNGISHNTGNCELGWFSLKQSCVSLLYAVIRNSCNKICDWACKNRAYLHKLHIFRKWYFS